MNLFEENLNALTECYPELVDHLKDVREDIVISSQTVEDKEVLIAQAGGEIIQLDSLYDMEPVLNLWRKNMPEVKIYAKILLFGFGNGMMARKLLSSTDPSNQIIVYEPDFTVLSYVMEHFDISDLLRDERVTLVVRSEFQGTISNLYTELLSYVDINTFQYYVYPNYNRLFKADYMDYMEGVEDACNSINSTQEVIGRFNEEYFLNTFANLKDFLNGRSIENLYETLPADMPAIVVASGPSLDKNVALLEKAKDHAFIICVDSALRTVLKTGVLPDLCVSIDPKKLTKHFSDDRANDIPMICRITSNREVLSKHRAEKFFVNDLNHHIQNFFSQHEIIYPVLSSGGSVANDALSIAKMLGFTTIILIGQDLAYTDNKTHSAASVRGEWNVDVSKFDNNVMTEDIYGNPILSSGEFTLYRTWIEEQIDMYPELYVIDATEGGAKIRGTTIMTFDEAIRSTCDKTCQFAQIIQNTERFMSEEVAKEFMDYMYNIPSELSECEQKAIEALRAYDRMLDMIYADKYHSNGFKKMFAKIGEISDYLDAEPVMEYVKNDMQKETNEFLKDVYDTKDSEREELIAACNVGRDYMERMKKSIDKVTAQVQEQIAAYGEN